MLSIVYDLKNILAAHGAACASLLRGRGSTPKTLIALRLSENVVIYTEDLYGIGASTRRIGKSELGSKGISSQASARLPWDGSLWPGVVGLSLSVAESFKSSEDTWQSRMTRGGVVTRTVARLPWDGQGSLDYLTSL